jgi:phosphatidylinositol alpha-1,6-mannosyltransferase
MHNKITYNNMKILFITRKFPPSVGGMENFAADLYESLDNQMDVKLVKWGGSNKWLPIVLPWLFLRAFWYLTTHKVDVIHIQDGVLSPPGWLLKAIFRKPLVVVIHGLDVTYKLPLYQKIIPWFLSKADKVICISGAAQEEVTKRQVSINKSVVIPLGIPDNLFADSHSASRQFLCSDLGIDDPKTKIILSVGRLVKRKGVAWFIDNVMPELVKASNYKLVFLISGDGEDRSSVEQAIARQKLEKYVYLLGRTSDEYRKHLYNGADVFVMPNIVVPGDMEGFGIVLVEAALCELPVVASGIEGIKDAIADKKNGVLVPSEDAGAFVREIETFLRDDQSARAFGKQARQYSLNTYNWSTIGKRYVTEYEKLVK